MHLKCPLYTTMILNWINQIALRGLHSTWTARPTIWLDLVFKNKLVTTSFFFKYIYIYIYVCIIYIQHIAWRNAGLSWAPWSRMGPTFSNPIDGDCRRPLFLSTWCCFSSSLMTFDDMITCCCNDLSWDCPTVSVHISIHWVFPLMSKAVFTGSQPSRENHDHDCGAPAFS